MHAPNCDIHIYISPDGTYPLHPGDIVRSHPGWQEGDALPEGWLEVECELPEEMPTARFEEGADELVDVPIALIFWTQELAYRDDDPTRPYTKWSSKEEVPMRADPHPADGPLY